MISTARLLTCLPTLLLLFAPCRAQTPALPAQPPLPVHVVRSISPDDADFSDLAFLQAEIGPARVVMLGEPTHGEGNVFTAKIRLIRYLREQLGFTTVAFESGFYDLHKAQQELEAGRPVGEAIGQSVFGIWTGTQEFQALLPQLGPGKLRVAGFDPQLSGDYGGDLVDNLTLFLQPKKGAAALHYDLLEEVLSSMSDHFAMPPLAGPAFRREVARTQRLLGKAAAAPGASVARRAEAAFWQQCLRSLLAQARDYEDHDPSNIDSAAFKAQDSNSRDAQMADNLLWYVRAHPQEKVICWGALPHLANQVEVLGTAELRAFRPMGRAVKAALGPNQVYILGTLAGGGSYQDRSVLPVPVPAAGTLEAELLAQPADYAFVSLKHDAPGRKLTTYAFQYQPLAGAWSEVVDGFLFLRAVEPPHDLTHLGSLPVAADPAAGSRTVPGAFNPAARPRPVRVRPGVAGGLALRGVVLDRRTGQPVPYASVSVPGQGVGTVADGQGRFALTLPQAGALQVSSVGYAAATIAAPAGSGGAPLTVRLAPAAYELQGVQVRGESLDPRRIMKKVLAAAPKNYEQQDYSALIYSRHQTTNFDTLTYEAEYITQLFQPAGYRDLGGGFLMLGPKPTFRPREKHERKVPAKAQQTIDSPTGGVNVHLHGADPVRTSPLFKASTLRKFTLHLDSVVERAGETVYLISFAARRANHRSTGTYLEAGYSGRIAVQQRDHAVTHYEALWQFDTVYWNNAAIKHYTRHDQISRMYNTVLADSRTDQVVDYIKGANGRYHVRRNVAQGVSVGRVLGGRTFHYQSASEMHFDPLPAGTALPPADARLDPRQAGYWPAQLQYVEYRPEFWEAYQRPVK